MKKTLAFIVSFVFVLINHQIFCYKSLQEVKTDIDETIKLIDEDIKQIQDAYDPNLKKFIMTAIKTQKEHPEAYQKIIKEDPASPAYKRVIEPFLKLRRLMQTFNRHYHTFNQQYNKADDLYKSRELMMKDHAALKKYLTEIENKMDHIINIITELGLIGLVAEDAKRVRFN